MTLLVLAYLGGALTIISPCILPVLPFVFARAALNSVRQSMGGEIQRSRTGRDRSTHAGVCVRAQG